MSGESQFNKFAVFSQRHRIPGAHGFVDGYYKRTGKTGATLYPVEAALEYVGTTHDAAKSCNREGKSCAGNMSEIYLLTGYAMQLLLEGLPLKIKR